MHNDGACVFDKTVLVQELPIMAGYDPASFEDWEPHDKGNTGVLQNVRRCVARRATPAYHGVELAFDALGSSERANDVDRAPRPVAGVNFQAYVLVRAREGGGNHFPPRDLEEGAVLQA